MLKINLDQRGLLKAVIDNPPVNALSRILVDELYGLCDRVDPELTRMVVITSEGKHFSAGADLKEKVGMSDGEVVKSVQYLSDTFQRIWEIPVPTIAAINGSCLGGGMELALACDIRILADGASMGLKETSVGVIPGAGGTVRLPRLIGESRAKKWIFTAETFTAEEALADGVVDWLVNPDQLDNAVEEIFEKIASNAPLSVKASKKSINSGLSKSLKEALKAEQTAYRSIIGTRDRREGLDAFREKRPAVWKGK
ncbi:MAG: enoyl-CoA hydratase [Candidatus Marinimicrobia bacterium]|nr:enoyl-CoA hydratase [Candidatus Neomarinimicrobiota bacterium]|tara:strand:+ start:12359 stop:13123 length:765 start_codon:yes stop_codon:yes gene_type:complete